jgi:hypothetical protein
MERRGIRPGEGDTGAEGGTASAWSVLTLPAHDGWDGLEAATPVTWNIPR